MHKQWACGNAVVRGCAQYELALSIRTWLAAVTILFVTASPSLAESYQQDLVRAERDAEALITQRINAERAALAPDALPLVSDPALDEIARARSDAMAHGAPFSHEDVNGRIIAVDMMQSRFGPRGTWGENILEEGGYQVFDPVGFATGRSRVG